MPCFRGIAIFIGSESGTKRLPEFPHPDSSSVNLPTSAESEPPFKPVSSLPSFATDPDLTRKPKLIPRVNPRISVYVPSVPGAKFWIQYSIAQMLKPPCQLYFKLYLNGRNITSWGINPATTASGTVAKALFEPDHRWQCKDDRGRIFKPDGIEARFFQFLPSADGPGSSAEEGGVIEVQVFRAKGKKRRAPRLGECIGQERFGISTPSGGLMDDPADAAYFDWLLTDPKDAPYASFRFHYRPLSKLRRLSLIPPTRDQTPIKFLIHPVSTTTRSNADEVEVPLSRPYLEEVDVGNRKGALEKKAESSSISTPPEIFLAGGGSIVPLAQPSKMTRDGLLNSHLNRPLPPLPTRRPVSPAPREPPRGSPSDAVPISPSLHRAAGNEGLLDSEVRYGVGMEVAVYAGTPDHPLKPELVDILAIHSRNPTSDHENSASPPTPKRNLNSPIGNPTTHKPMAGEGVERQVAKFLPAMPNASKYEGHTPKVGFLDISEGEWMSSSGGSGPRTTHESLHRDPHAPTKRTDDQLAISGSSPRRGLLGNDLRRIPLAGPSGDLMKKLRSDNPFRGI